MSAYTEAVKAGLKGLQAVSTGACPGCPECAERAGFDPDDPEAMARFEAAWHDCEVETEESFSWSPCQVCGYVLGGYRDCWHAIRGQRGDNLAGREIEHFDSVCTDCVMYLANGEEPESCR